jgi:hypothetical protein
MDRVLAAARSFAAPFFGRWLEPEDAARAAEWATRIVISYLSCPRDGMDLTDAVAVRHLVATFVVPGVQALAMRDATARPSAAGARTGPARARPARTGSAPTASGGGQRAGAVTADLDGV